MPDRRLRLDVGSRVTNLGLPEAGRHHRVAGGPPQFLVIGQECPADLADVVRNRGTLTPVGAHLVEPGAELRRAHVRTDGVPFPNVACGEPAVKPSERS
jgi:hypothetical protein